MRRLRGSPRNHNREVAVMRKLTVVILAAALVVALGVSCSTKTKVVTGTKYKCKVCGRVYRDATKPIEIDKSLAKGLEAKTVEGYCPKCGDAEVEIDQVQTQKCPVCGADLGKTTKKIKIQRKLSDTISKETDVNVACSKPKCARVGALHEKYNWDWNTCAAIADQQIGYGYDEAMVREAWGTPKSVESKGNAKKWVYDNGYVVVGPSGKVVEIKQ